MKKKIVLASLSLLSFFMTGCEKGKPNVLKIAATSVPHAEILEFIQPDLKERGIDSEIIIVEDYNTPNRSLSDGEVDANFFQHAPFLEAQMKEFGYRLQNYSKVHIEPMALYSLHHGELSQLPDGAIIAIPSDSSNQARALQLLEKIGLVTLNLHDVTASLQNVVSNPKGLQFLEVDSALLSRTLQDANAAAITANFALQAGLLPKESLAAESSDSLFANILVIRQGEENRPELKTLKELLGSEKVGQFIEDRYQGALVPIMAHSLSRVQN